MSAIVCGKRSIFEELTTVTNTPPVSKRLRCSSSSPVRFSPPPPPSASVPNRFLIDQLSSLFPDMDNQVFERVLEECGDDLDSAIRSLNQLRLESTDVKSNNVDEKTPGLVTSNAEVPPIENPAAPTNSPMDGHDWVELFVGEMMSSSDVNDARARASRALEVLKNSICLHATTEAAKGFQQENMMLKEQLQAVIQENAILKRAVAIQHERQKEFDDKNQELQQLKQLVSQYQEQLRTLEVNNYALTMHLKQAQQSNSISGRFHPDVF